MKTRRRPPNSLDKAVSKRVAEIKSPPTPPPPFPKKSEPRINLGEPEPEETEEDRRRKRLIRSPKNFTDTEFPPEVVENPFHWRNLYRFKHVQKGAIRRVEIDAVPDSFYGLSFDDLSNSSQKQVCEIVHTLIADGYSDTMIMRELDMPAEILLYVKRRLYADAATEEQDRTNLDRYADYARFVNNRTRELLQMVQTAPNNSEKYMKAKVDAISKAVEMRKELLKVGVDLHIIDKDEEAGGVAGMPATSKMTDVELREFAAKERRELARLNKELQGMGVSFDDEEEEDTDVTPDEIVQSFNVEEDHP